MRICKRILSFVLTVCLLSFTVGSSLLDIKHMNKVHAVVAELALGMDVMYTICEYYGSVFLGLSCGRKEVNIHNDDVARLGYAMLTTCNEYGVFDPVNIAGVRPNFAVMGALDYAGQQYVFGSEALKQVTDTEFSVIQGGKNDGDGDDDDDDNIIHFPKRISDNAKMWFAMTTTGAAALGKVISDEYQKWVNGEPDNLLDTFYNIYPSVSADDIKEQWSGTAFNYNFNIHTVNGIDERVYTMRYNDYTNTNPMAMFISYNVNGYYAFGFNFIYRLNESVSNATLNILEERFANGKHTQYSYLTTSGFSPPWSDFSYSISANFPVFASEIAARAYLQGTGPVTDALNYAKTYRIADWLVDDWSGTLTDPLTGLPALSDWYNIARHQGLNALGDNPSVADLLNYLRDYFAHLGTDILPEVDPSLAPIKYPSTVQDVVIDPSVNPSVVPVDDGDEETGGNPGTGSKPGTGTDPDPGVDPTPNPDSPVDVPIEDIVPNVNDSFGTIAGTLRYKFPFSIPWDIHYIFNRLANTPKVPYFELPLIIERYGIEEYIIVDMEKFQVLSDLSRTMFSMLFAIYLINLTFKVVGMRKEE